ncbi:MAG: hypothetical protein PUF32_06080 [Prevotella sp.]|nr:hypothetical protein [Prevotella sp.]
MKKLYIQPHTEVIKLKTSASILENVRISGGTTPEIIDTKKQTFTDEEEDDDWEVSDYQSSNLWDN